MRRFIFTRLWQTALVMLLVSFGAYVLIGLMPGDPIDLMITANPAITSADVARLKALYGLDQPLILRWFHWLWSALNGDFGYSRLFTQPVTALIGPALINSLELMLASWALSLAIALPAGIYAALKPHSFRDYGINLAAFAGVSIPPFWLGLVAILVFAVSLHWLPAGGTGQLDDAQGWEGLRYLILPVATLTIASVGSHIRFVRGSMIEVMRQDFIRTARAKGLSERGVVVRHALRNGMMPVVTLLGLEFGSLFSGALITETLFSWPGMGRLIYNAVIGSDYNLAMAGLMLATLVTLIGNLLADIGYKLLDPRVKLS
ncbi:ABC transporter permease [Thalassospira sp. TSL5-1]|uniref:ABC transporter permease n=1 Tax=Thalassospira sp. TSL5-1 TaxID=1544451 RepID=UPI0009391ABC|nr:ABC transporter permease [Thalassospira sp. TSL5-1]OKH89450.1 diguanylate cyclase [Thalassospira sp. TSL5-1]